MVFLSPKLRVVNVSAAFDFSQVKINGFPDEFGLFFSYVQNVALTLNGKTGHKMQSQHLWLVVFLMSKSS